MNRIQTMKEKGRQWLKSIKNCEVVVVDWPYTSTQPPHVVGFALAGRSYMISCVPNFSVWESNRSLLLTKKEFRLGGERFLLTPPGLLGINEIPLEWGLLELKGKNIRVARAAPVMLKTREFVSNENLYLLSVLRNYVKQLEMDPDIFRNQKKKNGKEKDKE